MKITINFHGMEMTMQRTYHVDPIDHRDVIKIRTKNKLSLVHLVNTKIENMPI